MLSKTKQKKPHHFSKAPVTVASLTKDPNCRFLCRPVMNALPSHIAIVDYNGVILDVNDAWRSFAEENGADSPDSVGIGQNYLEVCRRAVGPFAEEAPIALAGLQALLDGSIDKFNLEYPCHSPAESRWFLLHAVPLPDQPGSAVIFHIDVSERKQMQRRLDIIYQMGQELALVRDEETVIWQVIELATKKLQYEVVWCGLADRESNSLLVDHLFCNGRRHKPGKRFLLNDYWAAGIGAVVNGQALNIVDTRYEAHWKPLCDTSCRSVLCLPMQTDSETIGVLSVGSQMPNSFSEADKQLLQVLADRAAVAIQNARLYETERKQHQQLQQYHLQLVQAEKMAALGRLIASIAHEINNPLQSIQGGLAMSKKALQKEVHVEKLTSYLELVDSEIDRIATMMHRLRDFYRPAHTDLEPTDLHAVLANVLDLAQPQFERQKIILEREFCDCLSLVRSNPDHLKQLFLNLVLNAIDAMSEGGRLSVRTAIDNLSADEQLDGDGQTPAIRVDFTDTGCGISAEELPHLFEPFYTTKDDGSGLGLPISYSLATGYNGRLLVNSQVGQGTTFTVLLPLVEEVVEEEGKKGKDDVKSEDIDS